MRDSTKFEIAELNKILAKLKKRTPKAGLKGQHATSRTISAFRPSKPSAKVRKG